MRLNGEWYCSQRCVARAARLGLDGAETPARSATALPPSRLGVLLRHMGVLSAADLQRGLDLQRQSGLRLGAQLREMGCVGTGPVLRALAAQAGVRYLPAFDVRRVMGAATLAVPMVRALGLVPFESDPHNERLHVVCTAPVPRIALRALVKLTGWTPVPYLIDDAAWEDALESYEPVASERHEALELSNLGEAAAHVAHEASLSGAVTMRSVDCDRYIWVRVEATKRVSDLIVTPRTEGLCRAAHIAH